jgi:hypothetical protein
MAGKSEKDSERTDSSQAPPQAAGQYHEWLVYFFRKMST